MVELDFKVEAVRAEPYAVSPMLMFALRLINKTPQRPILNVMLNCQVRIEPAKRTYTSEERSQLSDLFGESQRWTQTLLSFLWTNATAMVPAFDTERVVDLPVACSYDFNIAATKYFYGLENGVVPLSFLYSGSVFYRDDAGSLQIEQISWTKESAFKLPVATWREMMEHYYPQRAWLCLQRDAFDELYRFKQEKCLPTFEQTLQALLNASAARVSS